MFACMASICCICSSAHPPSRVGDPELLRSMWHSPACMHVACGMLTARSPQPAAAPAAGRALSWPARALLGSLGAAAAAARGSAVAQAALLAAARPGACTCTMMFDADTVPI